MTAAVLHASWFDRLTAVRDRLLTSPGFRRWAAAFPATRPVARRRAQALFDISAGFVYSQVLHACVELDVFASLAGGPKTAAALALRCNLAADPMGRLLDAACGLRLLSRRAGGRYGLGPLGAAMVNNPAVTNMVSHNALLYADLRDPVALLRGQVGQTALSQYWPYAAGQEVGAGAAVPYSALMAASQTMIAQEVLGAYDLRRHRCLMDVGGGSGAFIAAALKQAPGLRAILFDLPAVASQAAERFRSDSRVQAIGGSFYEGGLPQGADIASLVRVLHDHDDDKARHLLSAVHDALPSGGTLLLAEPMAETPGAETVGSYFLFYLLAMGSGRPRTAVQLTAMLHDAGFASVRAAKTSTPMVAQVLLATKL